MEQTCHTLKRTVKIAKQKMKKANKIAMQQNSFLISECNNLRHENLKYRRRVAELEEYMKKSGGGGGGGKVGFAPSPSPGGMTMLHSQSQPVLGSQQGGGAGGNEITQSQSVEQLYEEKDGGGTASGSAIQAARRHKKNKGTIIRGSTRPLREVAGARSRMERMQTQLDVNERDIKMQQSEIRRLRGQVQLLSSQLTAVASPGPGEE